ncbi:M56 family metallopeptidase [Parabacteroides chinchillae]|uniref:Outer membrane transport energization protein TonB n=1 Tax=Parabacteroides chinchillae TaxID=871327 RepID=A0A8G2BWG3_9BACT|nr:M56 family metallopeptidase [Parabacteroides chinchillae]SEF87339.1 outer membrane transport energization protein TonB [Parabacteroides chinchillae]
MNPEFAYFMKVNMALVLFYAFYRLFFYKDTFFKLRRMILLAFFGLALLYPLFNIQDWVRGQEPIADVIYMYSAVMLPDVTVQAAEQSINWKLVLPACAVGIYGVGVLLLIIRFFIQLGSIIRLAFTCRKTMVHGVMVRLLEPSAGPFSFFRFIFICPENFSDKETDEILTHECTHVSQWHSVDVIISEIIAIFCWFNPFVWLLKREVRHNLEYLADNKVIQAGYDSKVYQYHLLGLAHHCQVSSDLYNSFNVIHLKNRIFMMNKKRSHGIGRTKYLIFLPLVGILMLLSNIEAVARITTELANGASSIVNEGKKVKITATVVDEMYKPLIGANILIKGTSSGTITDNKGVFVLEAPEDGVISVSALGCLARDMEVSRIRDNMKIQLMTGGTYSEGRYFTVVEQMPRFPGGDKALLKFLGSNIKYPKEAQEKGIQGRVICSFIVDSEGDIRDAQIVRGVDPSLDTEALRVVGLSPKWTPGMQRGKAVPVKYTIPVTFSLQRSNNQSSESGKVQTVEQNPGNTVFRMVEHMPRFPGGESELLKFLASSIKYPKEAQAKGLQGRVICRFIVEKDGSVTGAEIVQGIDPSLDTEALRVVNSFPKWTPGMQRGKAVRVMYTVPVTFRLQ